MLSEMMNNPLLSVIVPIYKTEKYLERCLNSLVNQSYKNIEIILVEDGSPDNCAIICDEWENKYENIIVIHKQNEGLGFARNSGLKVAKGEYIAFVDSDDYIDFNMYEVLMHKAVLQNADIVYCGHHCQDNNGFFTDVVDFNEETIFVKEQMLDLSFRYIYGVNKGRNLMMSVWHSVYRNDIIKCNFFSEREVVSEDLHFQLSAILNSEKIVYLPVSLYYYCFNSSSLSHTFNFDKFYRFSNLSRHLYDLYSGYGKGEVAYYYFFYITISLMRSIESNSSISNRCKIDYYQKILKLSYWNEVIKGLDVSRLTKHFKFLYYILKWNRFNLLRLFIWFDYYVVCKKMKK